MKRRFLFSRLRRLCSAFLIFSCLICSFSACAPKVVDLNKRANKSTSAAKDDGVKDVQPNKGVNAKRVAITFDDGPHSTRTKAVADELAKYGYTATFFVVGNRVDVNGAKAVKYAYAKGNEIAIHGYTHSFYYNVCDEKTYNRELSNTYDVIKEAVPDAKVKLMRPIGGKITDERVESCPYSVIMWSVDSEDWKYRNRGENDELAEENINTIVDNVMSKVKSGDIILLHDIYQNTYEATKIILKRLHNEGYDVVSVSELFEGSLKQGTKYFKAPSKS